MTANLSFAVCAVLRITCGESAHRTRKVARAMAREAVQAVVRGQELSLPIPGIWFATATPIATSSSSASSSVTRTFNPGQLPEWMLQVQAPRVDARAATNSLFSWSDLHSSSLTTPEEQTEWLSAEQFFVGSPRDASTGPSTISVLSGGHCR